MKRRRASRAGYQSIEGGAGARPSGDESKSPDLPQTFLSKVKKAREENVGCCNFCMAFFALILGSILWTIIVVVIITVPIVMIAVGAEYLYECPIQKMIPVSLLVAGCVLVLSIGVNTFPRFRHSPDAKMAKVVRWINVVFFIFWFAWIFATSYWVYGTNPDFDESVASSSSNYCSPHLYGFVYWLLNLMFIFIGTLAVMCGLVMCIAMWIW